MPVPGDPDARLLRALDRNPDAPGPGHYVFSIEVGDSFPYSPVESYRLLIDGKVLGEGSLRAGSDLSAMGNFKAAPGASPTAPPIMKFAKPPVLALDFSDTTEHQFQLEYSHSGDRAGGGVTLKWVAPRKPSWMKPSLAPRKPT